MDESVKVNFFKHMMVLKIRDTYKAPYHKNKYVAVRRADASSMVDLKKHLQQYTGNWSSGTYDIQFVLKEGTYMQPAIYSTFCRIDVRDGKIVKLWKTSPYSKKPYPCWEYFDTKKEKVEKPKKTVAKKAVGTKKATPKKKK